MTTNLSEIDIDLWQGKQNGLQTTKKQQTTMNEKKLGQEPAFPALEPNDVGYGDQITLHIAGQSNFIPFTKGMSKRFYAACAAMQGILANPYWIEQEKSINFEHTVNISLKMADELLKQENQP